MKIIAHRGFSSLYPENTMLAFKKAYEQKAQAIELDVHLSKNNKLVIIHDETIDRTSNGSGKVMDLTFKELKEYDFSYKFKDYGNCPIISLDEYFDYFYDKDIITNIEIKTDKIEYENIEKLVLGKIYAYGLVDKVIISSFNINSLKRIRNLDSQIKIAYLRSKTPENIIDISKDLKLNYYHPKNTGVSIEMVGILESMGVLTNLWFDNKTDSYDLIDRLKPYGIIVNHIDRFL